MNTPLKRWLENDEVAFIVRALLGLIFIAASIDKLSDTSAFAAAIGNYRFFSPLASMIAATVLPWLELLCGLALLVGVFHKGASTTVLGLTIVFTAAVIAAIFRGLDITCGCFSLDPDASRISWLKIAENSLYLVMAMYIFAARNSRHTLEEYLKRRREETE